jgi:hypothetical protein
MQNNNPLIQENIDVLKQGLKLLNQLQDGSYLEVKHPFSEYGIGSHFRHCLDFYQSFLDGIVKGSIDYDDRHRDGRIEKDRTIAISKFQSAIRRLEGLSQIDNQMTLLVRLEDREEQERPSSWSYSSVQRELQALVSHTVHHYALIAIMLQLKGFQLAEEFGVAPSTLRRWRSTAPCAQ